MELKLHFILSAERFFFFFSDVVVQYCRRFLMFDWTENPTLFVFISNKCKQYWFTPGKDILINSINSIVKMGENIYKILNEARKN